MLFRSIGRRRLADVVEQQDDMWRAVGPGQVRALAKAPVHRIPARFDAQF